MVFPVCNKLTWQWTKSQKSNRDACAAWLYGCQTCMMERRMQPHAGYHVTSTKL